MAEKDKNSTEETTDEQIRQFAVAMYAVYETLSKEAEQIDNKTKPENKGRNTARHALQHVKERLENFLKNLNIFYERSLEGKLKGAVIFASQIVLHDTEDNKTGEENFLSPDEKIAIKFKNKMLEELNRIFNQPKIKEITPAIINRIVEEENLIYEKLMAEAAEADAGIFTDIQDGFAAGYHTTPSAALMKSHGVFNKGLEVLRAKTPMKPHQINALPPLSVGDFFMTNPSNLKIENAQSPIERILLMYVSETKKAINAILLEKISS